MTSLSRIFEPIHINGLEVPNRVARTAHSTHYSYARISDDFIDYHAARARGGCGLSILEAASVHPSSMLLGLTWDIDGYRRLMEAVRPHGMRIFQQLWHGGHHVPGRDGIAWGPSGVPSPWGHVPVPMDKVRIDELVRAFAEAAVRCREGGLDGVEIHGAHGYIFHQFLSPLTNKREDDYGGSLENRMRLLAETLQAVRRAVGEDYPVGVRLSASEAPGSIVEEEQSVVASVLEERGLIDFLDVSLGDYYRMISMNDAMDKSAGYELPSSARIVGAARRVPRIVTGRFRTLEEAEQVLREGTADIVSLVRAQIADPDLVHKTREGRAEQVRPCVACNQGCIGGLFQADRMGCLVNPAVGNEATLSDELIRPTAVPQRILVIGGGPAGMEAARVARLAGHEVILAEATPRLGGMIDVARRAPYLGTLGDIAYWLEQEIYRLGVDVRLSTPMDSEAALEEAADVVIVATGATPRMDGFQSATPWAPARGVDQPHVMSSVDLLTMPPRPNVHSAVVLDDTGQYEAIAVVDELLKRRCTVTLVTRHIHMTPAAEFTQRTVPAMERFGKGDFTLLTRSRLDEIGAGSCTVQPIHGGRAQTVPADLVVLISPPRPENTLFDELAGRHPRVLRIGDAHAPRDIQAAIAEGRRMAMALDG